MTLMLVTESHGEVASGFYSAMVHFARVGEHCFTTRSLCELAQNLAVSGVNKANLVSYDLETFDDRFEELISAYASGEDVVGNAEASVRDETNLEGRGSNVEVRVMDERKILIGDYRIQAVYFGRMAVYLARGGFYGWIEGMKPSFADSMIETIKGSSRDFYKQIRKELEE